MNLNVSIAKSGVCSRRKAATLIKEGKVKVNGRVVREPWHEVGENDTLMVDGKRLRLEQQVYLVVNKPKGVTTTVEDRFAEQKVVDLVPKKYGRVYPAGRLDKDTRGLIVLTNDGALCYALTHPKFEIEKVYLARVEGKVDEDVIKRLLAGVQDEEDHLRAKSVSVVRADENRCEVKVIISEGKKRHIRRLFKAVGCRVVDLKRIRIGNLELGDLDEGSFRQITRDQAYRLCKHKDGEARQ